MLMGRRVSFKVFVKALKQRRNDFFSQLTKAVSQADLYLQQENPIAQKENLNLHFLNYKDIWKKLFSEHMRCL